MRIGKEIRTINININNVLIYFIIKKNFGIKRSIYTAIYLCRVLKINGSRFVISINAFKLYLNNVEFI